MDLEILTQIAYALGIGVLFGLERSTDEPSPGAAPLLGDAATATPLDAATATAEDAAAAQPVAEAPPDSRTPSGAPPGDILGVRTFAVLSLAGWALGYAGEHFPWAVPAGLLTLGGLVIAMYLRAPEQGPGITTEAAAIASTVLGLLCRVAPREAGAVGILVAVALASKRFTHGLVQRMRRVEVTDTIKLLVVAGIVLPILPNRAIDPWGALNPAKVGLLAVLISGVSFVGYFLTRILGPQRGLGLTGVVGGLTSSTAVTAAMAQQARAEPGLNAICVFSTIAANATMFGRVLVVVAVVSPPLALRLAWPIGAMAAVAAVAAAILWLVARRAAKSGGPTKLALKNPFSLGPALKFAAFFAFVLLVAKLAKHFFGDRGLYAAAGLSGLADVDAIMLSLSEQSRDGSVAQATAAIGITIAVVSNSVVKSGIALASGGARFGRLVALSLGAATGTGLVVAVLQP